MSTKEFKECAACAAKPGAPTLCAACLHNRALVNELRERIDQIEAPGLRRTPSAPSAYDKLAARVADLEDAARLARRPHPPITGRGYTQNCPCPDCRERQLEAVTKAFDDLGKSHRETVDREIAHTTQCQALRACVIYARDHSGPHFDFDTWKRMVDAALSEPGAVPPHALEEAQSELLHVQTVLDLVRKDRDQMLAALGKARSEVVGLLAERDRARAQREEAQSALLRVQTALSSVREERDKAQYDLADQARLQREAIVRERSLRDAMDIIACDLNLQPGIAPGVVVARFQECGFETSSDDELIKHIATMKLADSIRVTKRADGAYTAGPPPDGRSVDEHLTELATGKNPPRCGLGDFDGGCVLLGGHAGAHVGYAVDKDAAKKDDENALPMFTLHESLGQSPYATLEVIDEVDHFRVRVREPHAKASIFLTPPELEKLQLNIGFLRGRRMGQRQPPIDQPAGAKYTGVFKDRDTLARYILLHWLPSRNRGELFAAIQKMEDMNLATDELALILQHQGIPPNRAPHGMGPLICRWTRAKVIDCKYCQGQACSQHPSTANAVRRSSAGDKDWLKDLCECDEEERHAALQYEHDDLTSVGGEDDTLMRIYCQRAGQVLHHGCGWCAEHNRPAFECMCNGPRATARVIGNRVPRCEVPDCKAAACHGEHWHDKLRWWCNNHVPMSGHYEHCPEPCRSLVKGVTFKEVFTDLARCYEHLRKP